MNHQNGLKKLNRTASHRKALIRNLATALVIHNQIETTLPKAKVLKKVADKLVTLGKRKTLHARRQAMGMLFEINRTQKGNAHKDTAVHKLFAEIAPRYEERNGGYTRVLRTRKRPGDNTQMAVIQFVEATTQAAAPKRRKRKVVKEVEAKTAPEAAAE
ncbi:MAG: 50S ribosomal protein L17 [Proteobacteria bacterium]|nr:50S ribosomal protein L17 [Pseudomonadota bacterium]